MQNSDSLPKIYGSLSALEKQAATERPSSAWKLNYAILFFDLCMPFFAIAVGLGFVLFRTIALGIDLTAPTNVLQIIDDWNEVPFVELKI